MSGQPRTAVVTGASSGIGREFARRLAGRGERVLLVARRRDLLESLAAELGGGCRAVPADLAAPDGPRRVAAALAADGLHADTLVNAAGFGTHGPVVAEDPDRIADEVRVNVLAPTVLTRLLLPDLLASPRGVLVNVSSSAAAQPVATMAVYAATKAYLSSFTEALWQEARGTRLAVLSLCPGPTETEFFDVAGSRAFRVGRVDTAEQVVDVALAALARRDPPPSVTVGAGHRVQGLAARVAPRRLTLAVAAALTARAGRAEAPAAGR